MEWDDREERMDEPPLGSRGVRVEAMLRQGSASEPVFKKR
jgi:hypothetical protein